MNKPMQVSGNLSAGEGRALKRETVLVVRVLGAGKGRVPGEVCQCVALCLPHRG